MRIVVGGGKRRRGGGRKEKERWKERGRKMKVGGECKIMRRGNKGKWVEGRKGVGVRERRKGSKGGGSWRWSGAGRVGYREGGVLKGRVAGGGLSLKEVSAGKQKGENRMKH